MDSVKKIIKIGSDNPLSARIAQFTTHQLLFAFLSLLVSDVPSCDAIISNEVETVSKMIEVESYNSL